MRRIASRTIYALTLAGVAGLLGGFALASVAITSTTQNGQANFISAGGAVTGLTFSSAVLGSVGLVPPSASTGTASTPQTLGAASNSFCLSASCTTGHIQET